MEEIIDIQKYFNNINELNQIIKSCLSEGHNKNRPLLNNNLYISIINELNILFSSIDAQFLLNNIFVRNILICGDVSPYWKNDVIIYLGSDSEMYVTQYINNLTEIFKLRGIVADTKEKNSIKFILNVKNIDFSFIIKKRNIMSNYKYFFEINQYEYDIKNNILLNMSTNKTYILNDPHILNIKKMDLFSLLNKKNDENIIIEQTQNNPLIIFELIELLIVFPNFFNTVEVNNFLINLNTLVKTQKDFTKHIQDICDNDDELLFYKEIIKFAYNLEENGMYHTYVKYLVYHYDAFLNIVTGVKFDKEIFELFDNNYFKDFVCYLIFQHLIYKKRTLFKINKRKNKTEDDLLDIFMNGNNLQKRNLDTKNFYIDNLESDLYNNDNDNINDISLLDKHKFKSLKHLKEIAKSFVKFENLIKIVPISSTDQIYIKHFYNLNMILYAELKDIRKHHALKLAYIVRRFHFMSRDLLEKSIKIFNYLMERKGYDKYFIIHDNFADMVTSKILNDYIFKKMTNIPKIKTNFENNTDCIDITDYQDTFVLFIEFVYKNKANYVENESELTDFFESVFESGICDMRAYRLFKNESRRKKEKKLKKIKKEKKEKKEQKRTKYKIVNSNLVTDLNESDYESDYDSDNNDNCDNNIKNDNNNNDIDVDIDVDKKRGVSGVKSELINIGEVIFTDSDSNLDKDSDIDINIELETNNKINNEQNINEQKDDINNFFNDENEVNFI